MITRSAAVFCFLIGFIGFGMSMPAYSACVVQELSLEHTLFDLAWLPPSVTKVSLRCCIVRRPFMEAILQDKRLFKSFWMTALPGDRWRIMGEVRCPLTCTSHLLVV